MKEQNKKQNIPKSEVKYSYEQLFQSKKFNKKYQRDLSKVVLKDGKYTIEEAINILNNYFKK